MADRPVPAARKSLPTARMIRRDRSRGRRVNQDRKVAWLRDRRRSILVPGTAVLFGLLLLQVGPLLCLTHGTEGGIGPGDFLHRPEQKLEGDKNGRGRVRSHRDVPARGCVDFARSRTDRRCWRGRIRRYDIRTEFVLAGLVAGGTNAI
jgi:hypothetical protein